MKASTTIGLLGVLLLIAVAVPFFLPTTRTDASDAPRGSIRVSDQQVQITRSAVASLQAHVDTFSLKLSYHGPDPKTYRSLHIGVKPPIQKRSDSFVKISKDQAMVLIGCLARDGMLYRGAINSEKSLVQPKGPHYFLYVQAAEDRAYFEYIPWGGKPYRWHGHLLPPLLQQVTNLRGVLVGEAAKAIDALAKPLAVAKQPKDK